ncbi:MAG: hypothetical protein ACYTG1_13320 [Planctomycetota bacterium]|jgi:endoglucanase
MDLTATPTAAGREWRVVDWIEAWARSRPVDVRPDAAGNLLLVPADAGDGDAPLLFTAHLDHPAFVVEELVSADTVRLTFRGTVRAPYFRDARIRLHPATGSTVPAQLVETRDARPLRECVARLDEPGAAVAPGDVGTWDLPAPRLDGDLARTVACDDLAAVAAALAALDELMRAGAPGAQVLLTRAEEVGFIGATAACRLGTIPPNARLLALENSRSFADSPIGAGPIVRVGDRVSTFDPDLTHAVAGVAAGLERTDGDFAWQRRLMAGGTCEATVFCSYGLAATCVCLPLGNYHNQGELDRVEAGRVEGPAPADLEFISVRDFHRLVDLLVACGQGLGVAEPVRTLVDRLYDERRFVIEAG